MSVFTPGPWRSLPDSRQQKGHTFPGFRIDSAERSLMAWIETGDATDAEARANARLMAAAPDLLEALQALWGYFEDLQKSNPGYLGKMCLQDYGQLNKALILTPAALKKATE